VTNVGQKGGVILHSGGGSAIERPTLILVGKVRSGGGGKRPGEKREDKKRDEKYKIRVFFLPGTLHAIL